MSAPIVTVANLHKVFKLPLEQHNGLKQALLSRFRGKRGYVSQHVLRGVSFEIQKGEFFGIVGRNGSGKSTLLKTLAGIYSPDEGLLAINGSLTPFIELGVGFNPELTGRENVYLNGALLGFSRSEMDDMYHNIVEFAELERFMDQKLKNYSSGMQVRLAFSIAIKAKSDILLLDEVLAVGDAAFQRKCFEYFKQLKQEKRTVIFISHDMESVRKYCDRAIMIEKGKVVETGSVETVIRAYTRLFMDEGAAAKRGKENTPLGMPPSCKIDRTALEITQVSASGSSSRRHVIKESDATIRVDITIRALRDVGGCVPGVIVANISGEFITASNSYWMQEDRVINMLKNEERTITFLLPNIYEKGDHKVSVNAVSADLETFYSWKNEVVQLHIDKPHPTGAKVNPKFEMRVK